MDDCATGCDGGLSPDELAAAMDELLSYGGFGTKGYTISGRPPLPSLSRDGVSISVLGRKFSPEEDIIQLDVGPLNFNRKIRGRKVVDEKSGVIPKKLTMKVCSGKVAEIFDIGGLVAPILASFKIDLHDLILSRYGWDDPLSTTDREMWIQNFQVMEKLGGCKWNRLIVPKDAVSLDMEIIGSGDASEKMACSAIYVRFLRTDGTFSCQLALAKTKIVPDDKTLPKAELFGATLNTHSTEMVKRALNRFKQTCIYVLDSEIALHWLASETKRLKPWTRNRVIEISRFSAINQWFHIESDLNPADLGTRKGVTIEEVDINSKWINGKYWMERPLLELMGSTLKNVEQVKLKNEQLAEAKREQIKLESDLCQSNFVSLVVNERSSTYTTGTSYCPAVSETADLLSLVHDQPLEEGEAQQSELVTKIQERLKFSRYIIDPNRYRFAKVIRIIAMIIKFCKYALSKIGRKLQQYSFIEDEVKRTSNISKFTSDTKVQYLQLSDSDIQQSHDYYFRKGTQELKSFVHPKCYEKESFEKDWIVYYSGRLSTSTVSFQSSDITEKMIDLSKTTFVVPIIDRNSPLAYAIINQVHWFDKTVMHSGVETTIRAVAAIAHILNVRDIVKRFRKTCCRCRYILKRTLDVCMGPASADQLCVAPPFFVTQADLCGPFNAYSIHNKRTTVKIYISVFVCCTTGTTSLKVMEGYDTIQFLSAFTRFANELGYPKKLIIDEGSQLVSGCEKVVLNMVDIAGRLNKEYGIEFDTCPVGGHNYIGKVERKVRTVRESLEKTLQGRRLSILDWVTVCSDISNCINNLPVAIGNEVDELENLDLITPNRLRLARNNSRSPLGPLEVTGKLERLLRLKTETFQSWLEA